MASFDDVNIFGPPAPLPDSSWYYRCGWSWCNW